jgi:hypothetical protein
VSGKARVGKVVTTRCTGRDGQPGTLRTVHTADGGFVIVFTPDRKAKTTTTRKPT